MSEYKMKSIEAIMGAAISQLNDVREKLHNHKEESMAINILIDAQHRGAGMIFVEIENDRGESIAIGSETLTAEGLRKIRISTSDIINHNDI